MTSAAALPAAEPFRAACVQLTSDRDPEKTFPAAAALIREAAAAGASLVMTPEVTPMLEPRGRLVLEKVRPEASDEWLPRYRALARETGAWLLLGSMAVKVDEERCANRSLLIDPGGRGRRPLRQDPHVRRRPRGRRVLPGVATLPPGRRGGGRGHAVGPHRHDGPATTCASRRSTGSSPRRERTISPCRPRSPAPPAAPTGTCCSVRGPSRPAASSSPRPVRRARGGPQDLRPLPHRRPVGRGARGRRRGAGGGGGGDRPRAGPKARRMVPSLGHDRPWTPPAKLREHAAD